MLETLTKEQESLLPVYRDKWLQIGLSTEPACRDKAERAIAQVYRCVGLQPPRKIVWCGSPLSQGLTRAAILDKIIRDSVGASVGASVYGQHDANWLGFYDYFRGALGLEEQTEKIIGLIAQAQHAGWFLPHQYICWVSERHHVLQRDQRGRLHCVTGPAVMYPDGWAIYAWHGVRVQEAVIEQAGSITVEAIVAEQNTEVRRVMRNLYGTERFLRDAGAEEISREDRHGARLLRLRLHGDPVDIRAVELTCPSTGNKYLERVPPDISDCMEALGWRFRVQAKEYQPITDS